MAQLPGNKKKPHVGDQHQDDRGLSKKNSPQGGLGVKAPRPNRGSQPGYDSKADQHQGDNHNNVTTDTKPMDPSRAILPKKKSGGAPGQKTLSPIMQVMKAVTAAAINPKRKKATAKGSGDKVKTDKENQKAPNTIYKNQG